MSNDVEIQVVEGPMKSQRFVFDEHDIFIFGRAQGCHACLPHDPKVSRHHFIMEVNPPMAVLRDLGSLNGTYVNDVKHGARKPDETPDQAAGRRYPEIALRDGDRIRVGDTILAVRLQAGPAPGPDGTPAYAAKQDAGEVEPADGDYRACAPLLPSLGRARGVLPSQRCARCGKAVGDDLAGIRPAEMLCAVCRKQLADDPAGLLSKLLNVARAEVDRRGPPPIEGYNIQKKLGVGGFGAVYLARRVLDSQPVAVKIMLSRVAVDETARNRFLREIDILKRLRHDNIVPLLDHGSAGTAFYFVMDYCAGGSVGDLLRRRGGSLPIREAGSIILGALDGLAHAHSGGIVHRDIKPANILLSDTSGSPRAKMADFGLARSFEKVGFSGMTVTGNYAGTFPFMPREQVTDFKHSKPCSDVWSIAATFYSMLTGRYPHDFPDGVDPMEVVLGGKPVPIRNRNRNIPDQLAAVIEQALAVAPSARVPSASEFRDALRNVL